MKRIFRLALADVALALLLPISAQAGVNDFSFESFDASYELSLNAAEDNRPEMVVTEKIVALFPDFDQNHGIRRDIPSKSYNELPGLIEVLSVTDESGKPRDYEASSDGEFLSLAIKPSDGSFVRGRQTYVIKYSQKWVIKNYQSSSGFDEFYWDINGTGWLQNFDRVSATVSLDEKLAEAVSLEDVSCYQGPYGSNQSCDSKNLTQTKLVFTANNLAASENLTVAIPFAKNVANTKGPDISGTLPMIIFWICLAILGLILLWAIYFRLFVVRNQGKKAFVVPQYKPAKEPGLLNTALVARKPSHLIQALVVEAAVKGELEIQAGEKKKDFVLRRTSTAKDETGLLATLGLVEAGAELNLGSAAKSRQTREVASRLETFISAARRAVSKQGYFLKRALGLPAVIFLVSLIVLAVWIVVSVILDSQTEAGFVAAPLITFGPFFLFFWLLVSKRALSAKGSEVVSYLDGLKMYIELAEKDRLEFLQSPQGALLKDSELKGSKVLKLYEEVLPWAILLGLQEQWGKVLTELYAQNAVPVWFVGAPLVSEQLSNLDAALASSLATSSSGGSSGGGSSGGGGGGGGGSGI